MKHTFYLLCSFLHLILVSPEMLAQDSRDTEIRQLENLERLSVLKGDTVALFNRLWSGAMVINSPANTVGTVEATKNLLKSGGLNYRSFERNIEKIAFTENVAIVMGEEIILPQGTQQNSGKKVTRRFTNIWMFKNQQWGIVARQATIIKIE